LWSVTGWVKGRTVEATAAPGGGKEAA
jgi:hypothetical protein